MRHWSVAKTRWRVVAVCQVASYLATMKATIDLDEALYRRLKVEAARRGRTVRDLVADGIRAVIDAPHTPDVAIDAAAAADWYGSLNAYAGRAEQHDLGAMRASIARGRKGKKAR